MHTDSIDNWISKTPAAKNRLFTAGKGAKFAPKINPFPA